MEVMGNMRNLEQIRERDEHNDGSKLMLFGLGGLAAACVLFAVGVFIGREGTPSRAQHHTDPLARLDALAGQAADAGSTAVTYPERLVDPPARSTEPTAQLPGASGTASPSAGTPTGSANPSPSELLGAANTGVPTTGPLPASALLDPLGRVRTSVPATVRLAPAPLNRDRLNVMNTSPSSPATPGADGRFTLQVSSFRALGSAQLFAQRLRERGYHAFVSSGAAPNTAGMWYRVRIGPFNTRTEANRYRGFFEQRERLPSIVVRRDDLAMAE